MDPTVQRLADESDITKLMTKLSFGMDLRDRALYRSVFADEIDCDISALLGDAVPLQGKMDADEFSDNIIEMISQFTMTQHVNTMHLIEVHGDDATLASYVIGTHYLDPEASGPTFSEDPWNVIGARYDMRARRYSEGWRFTAFKWRMQYTRGNHNVWNEVAHRLEARRGDAAQV
jgi:hypothetical protein